MPFFTRLIYHTANNTHVSEKQKIHQRLCSSALIIVWNECNLQGTFDKQILEAPDEQEKQEIIGHVSNRYRHKNLY